MGGHYNKAKTVAENLKMNGALLSRFDLVFILLDQVAIYRDYGSALIVMLRSFIIYVFYHSYTSHSYCFLHFY